MYSRSKFAGAAQQIRRQEEHTNIGHHHGPLDTADAGRQHPNYCEEDAHIMAMLDEHLAFTQSYAAAAPWIPESESESESDLTTPQTDRSGFWTPRQSERPTSSGTMFVDWDEYGAPIISYRNGHPPAKELGPRPQPQGSEATMFVDWSDEGEMQVSYRDSVPDSHSRMEGLMLSEPREEYMGLGVSRGIDLYEHEQGRARSGYDASPPLTPQGLRSRTNYHQQQSYTQHIDRPNSQTLELAPFSELQLQQPQPQPHHRRRHVAPVGGYLAYQPPPHPHNHQVHSSHNHEHQLHPPHTNHHHHHPRPSQIPPVFHPSNTAHHRYNNHNNNPPPHQPSTHRSSAHHTPSYHPQATQPSAPPRHYLHSKPLPTLPPKGPKNRCKLSRLMSKLISRFERAGWET